MGNHVFVGERAVVNAALVGCYVYIGKDAIIVCTNNLYFICQVSTSVVPSINRTFAIGQTVCLKGLLLYRGRCSCTTRDCCSVLYSIRWQSGDLRWRAAWVHIGSHDRFYQKLLWAFFTGARLTLANNYASNTQYSNSQSYVIRFF